MIRFEYFETNSRSKRFLSKPSKARGSLKTFLSKTSTEIPFSTDSLRTTRRECLPIWIPPETCDGNPFLKRIAAECFVACPYPLAPPLTDEEDVRLVPVSL